MKDFLVSYVKYEETIKAPEQVELNKSSVRSIINSLSIVKDCSWEDAVKLLIKQAHKQCDSPINVTKEMLSENDFIKLPCNGNNSLWCELNKRKRPLPRGFKYIVKLVNDYYALLPSGNTSNFIVKGLWNFDAHIQNGIVKEIWIYIPGNNELKIGKNNITVGEHADALSLETNNSVCVLNNMAFNVINVNPLKREVGDCFLRALSIAYDCSWHEALDYIAKAIRYSDPVINQLANFETALTMLGFEKHKAIKNDNKRLDGVQFCEEMNNKYQNGERIVAIMGRNHCVAVVPSKDGGGYQINDTWDSCCRKIYEYWVFKISKSKKCQSNTHISHPTYGDGLVVKILESGEDKTYIACFDKVGVKRISELWLKNNGLL